TPPSRRTPLRRPQSDISHLSGAASGDSIGPWRLPYYYFYNAWVCSLLLLPCVLRCTGCGWSLQRYAAPRPRMYRVSEAARGDPVQLALAQLLSQGDLAKAITSAVEEQAARISRGVEEKLRHA
ncbi:hypothetical protein L9F63_007987, partial [Diploptera punctata]